VIELCTLWNDKNETFDHVFIKKNLLFFADIQLINILLSLKTTFLKNNFSLFLKNLILFVVSHFWSKGTIYIFFNFLHLTLLESTSGESFLRFKEMFLQGDSKVNLFFQTSIFLIAFTD